MMPGRLYQKYDFRTAQVILIVLAIILFNNLYIVQKEGSITRPDTIYGLDHFHYIAMSKGQDNYRKDRKAHLPPFCYRILTPYLANRIMLLGLSNDQAFFLLTNFALFLFLYFFYRYLRQLKIGHYLALLGVVLVGLLQGAIRWYNYQYWMSDPLALLFFLLFFYYLVQNNQLAAIIVLIIGVTIRENFLTLIPFYFLNQLKNGNDFRRSLIETAKLAVVPVLLYFLIQFYIISMYPRNIMGHIAYVYNWRMNSGLSNQLYAATLGSFGVILPLVAIYPRRLYYYYKKNYDELYIVIVIYLSLALANNTDRLLVYALPVLMPLTLNNAAHLLNKLKEYKLVAQLFIILTVGLHLLFYMLTEYKNPDNQPFNMAVTATLLIYYVLIKGMEVKLRSANHLPIKK